MISSCSSWGGKEGPFFNNTNVAPYNFSLNEIKEIIDEIKKSINVDYIIYNYHGGTEFNLIPEINRIKFFKDLINIGVNIIIGHHAHVPQGVGFINNSIIIYGLGNFLFDIPYHRSYCCTSESYFVQLRIDKNAINLNKYFYYLDLENGKVMLNTSNTKIEKLIDDSKLILEKKDLYIKAWEKDCFRLYLSPIINSINSNSNNNGLLMKKNNKILKFKHLFLFLTLTIFDLLNEYRRIFLIGSMMYIIKRFFSKER